MENANEDIKLWITEGSKKEWTFTGDVLINELSELNLSDVVGDVLRELFSDISLTQKQLKSISRFVLAAIEGYKPSIRLLKNDYLVYKAEDGEWVAYRCYYKKVAEKMRRKIPDFLEEIICTNQKKTLTNGKK